MDEDKSRLSQNVKKTDGQKNSAGKENGKPIRKKKNTGGAAKKPAAAGKTLQVLAGKAARVLKVAAWSAVWLLAAAARRLIWLLKAVLRLLLSLLAFLTGKLSSALLALARITAKTSAALSAMAGTRTKRERADGPSRPGRHGKQEDLSAQAAGAVLLLLILGIGVLIFFAARGNRKTAHSAPDAAASEQGVRTLLSDALTLATGRTGPFTVTLRGNMEDTLSARYREILDGGQGAAFAAAPAGKGVLWKQVRSQRKKELEEDPFLLLVNKWNYQPEGYEVQPTELPNGQSISQDCYEPLMKMLEDCAQAGGTPIVCSGYRPHWYQVNLFDEQVNGWIYAGYGQEEAEDLAATAVAIPGTSEHELGLAADIYSSENMDLDESQVNTFTQQWLMKNCWRYGFILRYPQDKSEITGIIFEPWHYRYVGKAHSEKIWRAGICLEEYLDTVE